MSAIEADEETKEAVNKADKSDIETARNIGLDDEMFAPVQEMKEESSRIAGPEGPRGASKDMISD